VSKKKKPPTPQAILFPDPPPPDPKKRWSIRPGFLPSGPSPDLDRQRASDRADDGIRRAREHAESVVHAWRSLALVSLERYLSEIGRRPFLTEQFIRWSRANGLPAPPDDRAFGSVIRSAVKLQIIEKEGFRAAATSNLGIKTLWIAGPKKGGT
jgi:hypothetical protein